MSRAERYWAAPSHIVVEGTAAQGYNAILMGTSFEMVTKSPEETQAVGRRMGELALGGEVLLLVGILGAGKTCLTQGVAWGVGVKEYARSPTFVMLTQYEGRLPLYHMDLYRVESLAEFQDLGLDEYLYGRGVSIVEWADNAMDGLPQEHLLIVIEYLDEKRRRLRFEAVGEKHQRLFEGLRRLFKATA